IAVLGSAVVIGFLPGELDTVRPFVGDSNTVVRRWAVCHELLLRIRNCRRRLVHHTRRRRWRVHDARFPDHAATKDSCGHPKNKNGFHRRLLVTYITRSKAAGSSGQEHTPEPHGSRSERWVESWPDRRYASTANYFSVVSRNVRCPLNNRFLAVPRHLT